MIKKINIGIIGLGYVGLPLSILFVKKGFKVFGFDIDRVKIKKIKAKKSYLEKISDKDVGLLKEKGYFYHTFSKIKECDFILVCVPTPLKKNNNPDLSFLIKTFNSIKKHLRINQTLILESTSYPGTTYELFVKKLSKKFDIGKNFFIGFSSERINPGFNENKISEVPKVVSGYTKKCLNKIINFYKIFFKKIVKAKSLEVAEFSKLLENIYRSVNIGFINEMKFIADKMNLDIFEIIKVAKTKPFGFRPFHPGPGIGGHCIPIDPHYLYWKATKFGIKANFIRLSAHTNQKVIKFVKLKILNQLKKQKLNKQKSKILLLGMSYKQNIDDLRESASISLLSELLKENIKNIDWSDPHISNRIKLEEFNYEKKGIVLNSKNLRLFDLVILMTDHKKFNYDMILKNSKLIIDCRGKFETSNKVIRG